MDHDNKRASRLFFSLKLSSIKLRLFSILTDFKWFEFLWWFFHFFLDEEDKKIVMNGINEFAKYTCIKFVQSRTSNQTDGYVLFAEHSSRYDIKS